MTEAFRGDILVSFAPSGRRSSEAIIDELRGRLEREVPQVKTEFAELVADQINDLNGVERPVEVKIFGPDRDELRRLAEQVGRVVEQAGAKDVNARVVLGNPDIVVRCDSAETARLGLTANDVENQLNAALYGQVAAALPEQDRLTNIRVRYPDAVRFDREALPRLPISLPPDGRQRRAAGPAARKAGIRAARAIGIDRDGAQPQRAVAREPAAGDHRDAPSWARATWAASTATWLPGWPNSSFRPAIAGSWRATTGPSRRRLPACWACSSWRP